MDTGITVAQGLLWVLEWFGVMLFYTLLDVAVWRKAAPRHARLLNLLSVALCMGGFLLGGLAVSCGDVTALFLSSALFALLHFNMVQTLSALIAGIVLGLLYIHTGSVACCIAAHAGYNMISFFTAISRDSSRVP